MTTDNQLEQLFIDLIAKDSAVITNACAVNHIQDNSAEQDFNYILVGASGTAPIYPGLPYMKTEIDFITGTRVIEHDEDGKIRDELYASVQSIARTIINAGTASYSAYGIKIDGCTEQPSTEGKNETHIFKNMKIEMNYRIIPVVPIIED